MAMFIEMMMNHTTHFIFPSVMRSMVNAKLVLDHIAAVTEKLPATKMMRSIGVAFSIFVSQMCSPKPRGTAAVRQLDSTVTQICPSVSRLPTHCGKRKHGREGRGQMVIYPSSDQDVVVPPESVVPNEFAVHAEA